jgi:hypothetical protein
MGGQIAERLRRMIRPEETPAGPAGAVRRWTAALSGAETEEFQAMIDDWLRERGGEGGAAVEITMALEINVAVETTMTIASESMDIAVAIVSEPMETTVAIASEAEREDAA